MNSMIASDVASAQQIFAAVSSFLPPLLQDRERIMIPCRSQRPLLISANPADLNPDSLLLINSDIPLGIRPLLINSHPAITYGCNSKATLTASSIEETKMVCCLQRTLELEDATHILPQEFPVPLKSHSVSSCLGAICILLYAFGESAFSFFHQE